MTAGPRGRIPGATLRAALVAGLALAPLVPAATPLHAQADAPAAPGCHCVDEDGNPVEGCRCAWGGRREAVVPRMRMEAPEVMAWSMALDRRARLGVTLGTPDDDAVGAPVTEVMENGPAARAGLRSGDVIVALDGHELSEPVDREREGRVSMWGNRSVPRLLEVLSELEPGEEVEVAYLRDGRRRTASITPEENPERGFRDVFREGLAVRVPEMDALREQMRGLRELRWEGDSPEILFRRAPGAPGGAPSVWTFRSGRCPGGDGGFDMGRSCVAGAELVALNPSLGSYFGAERGVLVPQVDDDSPLGLRPGDVILSIDGRTVDTPDDVRRILSSYDEDEEVTLRIMRDRQAREVRGRVGG